MLPVTSPRVGSQVALSMQSGVVMVYVADPSRSEPLWCKANDGLAPLA
jgi:hypothetical protein